MHHSDTAERRLLFRLQRSRVAALAAGVFLLLLLCMFGLFFGGIFAAAEGPPPAVSPVWGTAALLCLGALALLMFWDDAQTSRWRLEVFTDDTFVLRDRSGTIRHFLLGEVAQGYVTAATGPRNLLLISAQGDVLAEVSSSLPNFYKLERYLAAHSLTPTTTPPHCSTPYVELQLGTPNAVCGNAVSFGLLWLAFLFGSFALPDLSVLLLCADAILGILLLLILYRTTGALLFYSDGTFTAENWRGKVLRYSLREVRCALQITAPKMRYLQLIGRDGRCLAQVNSSFPHYEVLVGYLRTHGLAPIEHDPDAPPAGPPRRDSVRFSPQQVACVRRTLYLLLWLPMLLVCVHAILYHVLPQHRIFIFSILSVIHIAAHLALAALLVFFYPLFHLSYPKDCILYKQRQEWKRHCIRFPLGSFIAAVYGLLFSRVLPSSYSFPSTDPLAWTVILLLQATVTGLFVWQARRQRQPWTLTILLAIVQFALSLLHASDTVFRILALCSLW